MEKILLIYTSLTGNTEQIAAILHSNLTKIGLDVTVRSFDADFIDPEELLLYDRILFGTYTYEDGDLPYEVEDFSEEMEGIDFTGKIVAVFGSGDTFYEHFGNAIDTMAERFRELGADVLPARLKVDLDPDEQDEMRCESFVTTFVTYQSTKLKV